MSSARFLQSALRPCCLTNELAACNDEIAMGDRTAARTVHRTLFKVRFVPVVVVVVTAAAVDSDDGGDGGDSPARG